MEQIRIFITSPSDVAEERLLAYRVIERLSQAHSDRAQVQAVMWEHEPLLAKSFHPYTCKNRTREMPANLRRQIVARSISMNESC